jgi:hypothetical protein
MNVQKIGDVVARDYADRCLRPNAPDQPLKAPGADDGE